MKQYRNGMYATEISRKQIGVIYGLAKRHELKVEKWMMSDLYDLADFYGYDDNRNGAYEESKVKDILDAIFAKDIEKAQALLDAYTEETFSRLGWRTQKSVDRNMVV